MKFSMTGYYELCVPGLNWSGFSQCFESWWIAQMFTKTLVPFRTS